MVIKMAVNMKIINRFLPVVLLAGFMPNQSAHANTKYYRYDGDMPFIEMMLNMMTMGMIDKVPRNFPGYGNYYNNPNMGNRFTNQSSPCANKPCGTNNPSQLNGVWITKNGEMLGINNQQFLWTDGRSHYLTGLINARGNAFSLKVKSNGLVMNYQYQLDNSRMQTRDSNGEVRNFIRLPMNRGYRN